MYNLRSRYNTYKSSKDYQTYKNTKSSMLTLNMTVADEDNLGQKKLSNGSITGDVGLQAQQRCCT